MKERKFSKIRIAIICVCIIIIYAFGLRSFMQLSYGLDLKGYIKNITAIRKIDLINAYIDNYYYHDYSEEALAAGPFKGIVNSLGDKYSEYYTKKEYSDFNVNTNSEYGGIGAALTKDSDTGEVVVNKVYDNTPAGDAGIQEGDTIVSVDGTLGISLELDDYVQLIRGKEGSKVTIVYRRKGEETEVELTRRVVKLPTVSHNMIDGNIGYIQISQFATNTATEFIDAVYDLKAQGMTSVIYDLRANPGGLVDSVVAILDEILPEGITVYMEDKNNKRIDYTSDAEKYMDLPCVVLVDNNTASASEIFAGAIRDFDYGTIVGTTTTGKGVVQNVYSLGDGSAMKLTIAGYFTPSGTSINGTGLTPDVILEYHYDSTGEENEEYEQKRDNQIQKAVEILKGGE